MGKLGELYGGLVCCCIFWWGMPADLHAQARVAEKRTNRVKIVGDTSSVYYSTLANPTEWIRLTDGLKGFEEVDVTWGDQTPYVSLGNLLTAPSYDLVYQAPTWNGGFRVGLNQFDRFRLGQNDVRYYQITGNRPFTDLYYSQINQKNNFIRAEFAHRFSENVYLGLQYSLANQIGFYNTQQVRNQNIGVTIRAFSKNKRYHGYFSFFTNAVKHENNHGVTVDSIVNVDDDFLVRIPTASNSAQTRHNRTELRYTHLLYNKGVDSLGGDTEAARAWRHDIRYQFNRYKFFDNKPPSNGSLYGVGYVNPRGIRLFIRHQLLENTISVRQALGGSLTSAPLWVQIYGAHRWNGVYQEPKSEDVHNFSIGTILQNNPQFRLKYRLHGQVTWAAQQLDFFARARLGYDLKALGYLEGSMNFQRYQVGLIDRQLYVSLDEVWDNNLNFKQIQVFNFGGNYTYRLKNKLLGLYVRGEVLNHTLTNWVYYDSRQQQPLQAPTSINLLQVKGQADVRVWKIHLDNQIIWQPILAGAVYFRAPELVLRHNLYLQSWIFKRAMFARVGVLFQYHSNYFPYAYAPLTGAFYLQDEQILAIYPRLDAYVSFRIWQFRCFIRGENLGHFLYRQNYFTAHRHPITNFVVRVGISWRLFD